MTVSCAGTTGDWPGLVPGLYFANPCFVVLSRLLACLHRAPWWLKEHRANKSSDGQISEVPWMNLRNLELESGPRTLYHSEILVATYLISRAWVLVTLGEKIEQHSSTFCILVSTMLDDIIWFRICLLHLQFIWGGRVWILASVKH